MRRALVIIASLLASAALRADVITLPAAASIQGGNPFFSDVRVFNTSYTAALDVTATYRCFIGNPCPGTAPVLQIHLAPRESQAFDDMVADAAAFNAHDTAGGVEFAFTGSEGQLVVTSRLFSTSPQNSVGMFIPGLDESDAHVTTVLTSIRHTQATGGVGTFRTNVGVFNPEDNPANVTFTIFDGGTNQLGNPVTKTVGGHTGLQVSGIFDAAGAGSATTENAVIVVSADSEVFSYGVVIDNNTADPIFVVGAADQPQQPITPVPVTAVATPTPTPPGAATPTPTAPAGITATVNVGGDGLVYTDVATGTHTTTIHVGDTVHWVWQGSPHSTTSDTLVWDSGINNQGHTFDFHFTAAGSFPYHCLVHGTMMAGTVVVNP